MRVWGGTYLIILNSHIGILLTPMRNLHKEPANQSLADAYMKFSLILCTDEIKIEPLHRPLKLLPDVFGLLKRPLGEIVVPAPVLVVFIWKIRRWLFNGLT